MKTKHCSTCNKRKSVTKFSKCCSRKDGLMTVCKRCDCRRLAKWRRDHPNAGKEWWAKNPNYRKQWLAKRPKYYRRQHLLWAYGLTLEEYEELFLKQKGRCAICTRRLKKPVVDHSHKTKKVRGILCYCCNSALGFFQDSRTVLKQASAYLKRHE